MNINRMLATLLIYVFLTSSAAHPSQKDHGTWHTRPDKWSEPRRFHSEFYKHYEKRILISHDILTENTGKKVLSPNKAYWFAVHRPNYMKPPPWSTNISIFNERDYLMNIRFEDHNNYGMKVRWINEKLLYMQVWWGRILGSYLIFDVEKERTVVREMVNDGHIPFQQFQQLRNGNENPDVKQ